eukprot:m51a1_g10066 hypothetical protein (406) ;mRNA; r:92974-94541
MHTKFRGPDSVIPALSNVLHAYALHDSEIAYCQGMSFVAGVLLMYLGPEDAFWVFAAVMQRTRGFYMAGMPLVLRECHVFESLLHLHLPSLHEHFESEGVAGLLYVVPWFLPMFTNVSNWACAMRAWDLFFLEGVQSLHRVALAICEVICDDLVGLKRPDEIMPALLTPPYEKLHTRTVLPRALRMPISCMIQMVSADLDEAPQDFESLAHKKRPQPTLCAARELAVPGPQQKRHEAAHGVRSKTRVVGWLKKTLTPRPDPAPRASNPHADGVSPHTAQAFREFSSPVRYRGRSYHMSPASPASPVSPVMMELSVVDPQSSLARRRALRAKLREQRARAAVEYTQVGKEPPVAAPRRSSYAYATSSESSDDEDDENTAPGSPIRAFFIADPQTPVEKKPLLKARS